MLIDLTQEKWDAIRTALMDCGKLKVKGASSGKLIPFPAPKAETLRLCSGSER